MDVSNLDIKISQELIPYICTMKDGETVTDKVNLSLILGLFASQVVTLEKAAELAGKPIWDFIEVLKTYHIPWGEYTEDEMQLDEAAIDKISGGLYE
jgi:predicted HTH domain antitoxin